MSRRAGSPESSTTTGCRSSTRPPRSARRRWRIPDLEWGWAGLYENTPDHNALIGQADELPGFFYATGFSGHGFLQGPAVGELVADLYLEKPTFLDPSHFSANRFQGTETALREVNII
jgi:sarcosine oxidase subunit beta